MKQRIFTKAYISKLSGELDDATANIIHSGMFVPEDYCDGVATTLETHIDAPEGLGAEIMNMSLADASIAIYKSFQSLDIPCAHRPVRIHEGSVQNRKNSWGR